MTRAKTEIKCPYCGGTYNASGYTAHCRMKHPEHYAAYMEDKAAFVAKHKVGAAATTEPVEQPTPELDVATVATPEPTEPKAEPVEKQPSKGFLAELLDSII